MFSYARREYAISWRLVSLLFVALLTLVPLSGGIARAQDQPLNAPGPTAELNIAPEMIPPDMGQTTLQMYVPQTRHTVQGTMLDLWRVNGASSVYGNPISEPFAAANGYYSQAFENGIFQFIPDYLWSDYPTVTLMPISETILTDRLDTFRADGRRGGGGGDRRGSAWRPLDADDPAVSQIEHSGGVYVEETGHTLSGDLGRWFTVNEGNYYLGNPLSQPLRERGMVVQYFEGGLLMTAEGGTYLAPLVSEYATKLGIDTTEVAQGDLPAYSERAFLTDPNPYDGDPDAVGRKRIEVSISEQSLRAYQGDTLILQTLVSTGLAPNLTEIGDFHIRFKTVSQTMSGFTDSTGEVTGIAGQGSGIPWEVEDVPNVMYFDSDAEALHGAYWHNNFGNPMSHGCINLPLDVASFLFDWAPVGTQVVVNE